MHAVFVKVRSQYDATRVFTDQMAQAFSRHGYTTKVIDALAEPDLALAFAREAAATPTNLVYTVGALGEWRDVRGRSLGQIFDAPHVLQHVDYPLTHLERLRGTARDVAVLTVDQTHVRAITSTFGEDRFAHVGFCPHAAVGQPAALHADPDAFVAARPIPLLFTGSYYGPDAPAWRAEGGGVTAIFDAALEIALAAEFIPALDAVDQSLRAHGLDPADPNLQSLRQLSTSVHEQVRRVRRRAFLDVAGAIGLPLHIAGSGYEGQVDQYPSFTLLGVASLPEVTRLMGAARVVANVNANFGAGSHERPLTAMLAGAATASDHSAWWAEGFVEDQEILLYRWKDLEGGLTRLAALVNDPEAAWRMAAAGQSRVAEHRADDRVNIILAAAEVARARRRTPA